MQLDLRVCNTWMGLEWIKILGDTWPIYSTRSPSVEKATGESSKKSLGKDEELT